MYKHYWYAEWKYCTLTNPVAMPSCTCIILAPEELEKLKVAIKGVLRDSYIGLTLHTTLRSPETLENFVRQLIDNKIVTDVNTHCCTYEDVVDCFLTKLDSFETGNEIEIHCFNFADALFKLGGGACSSAKYLREEWSRTGRDIGCSNFLDKTVNKTVNTIIRNCHKNLLKDTCDHVRIISRIICF